MGRARNHLNTHDQRFSSVLGSRRGSNDVYALNVSAPTAEATTSAARYHAQLRGGDFDETLKLLNAHREDVRTAPLLHALTQQLAAILSADALTANESNLKNWFAATSIKTGESEHTICEMSGLQIAHLWPQGAEHPQPPRSSIAACGRVFTPKSVYRAQRGTWQDKHRQNAFCRECAREAWRYPETDESGDYPTLSAANVRALRDEGARTFVGTAIFAAFDDKDVGVVTITSLRAATQTAMREHLLDFTAERAHAGGESVLEHALTSSVYRECLRLLPEGDARLCDYVTPTMWRHLLDRYEADVRGNKLNPRLHDISPARKLRSQLALDLRAQLRRHLRDPDLKRPDSTGVTTNTR